MSPKTKIPPSPSNNAASLIIPLVITASLCLARPCLPDVLDKIAVVVNDEVITQSDIDRTMAPVYAECRTIYQGEELVAKLHEARMKVINKLIDDKLLLIEAKKEKMEVPDFEVDEMVKEARKNFPSREVFEKAMREQGLNETELKKRYKDQLMVRKLVREKVVSRLTVTPVEIMRYYELHKGEFYEPEKRRMSNILIRIKSDRSAEAASKLAAEILARLKEGGDFGGLARRYSEGPGAEKDGDMGYVRKGDLMPEIDSVIFGMKAGETSGIIQTILGYHIFRVEEIAAPKTRPLSEVSSEIEDDIFSEKIQEGINRMLKDLRKNAYISIK